MLQRIRTARDEGFTLIELLIVIVILGILAAIVVFAVGGITDRGQQSACKSDVTSINTAAEAYFAQKGSGAATLTVLVSGGFLHSDTSIAADGLSKSVGTGTNGYKVVFTAGTSTSAGNAAGNLKADGSGAAC
ncbi:MAG: ral secretion pathway protein [Frankiaceae bacterium]|jgi:general secretion pathway protein G|nr:ral secretion pathway protein [Frankiaceae bacterium]